MNVRNDIAVLEIAESGRARVVAFYANADVIDCDDALKRYVLVAQDIEQLRAVLPDVRESVNIRIDLDSIKSYLIGIRSTVTLGDMSRLYNDLLGSLAVRGVVPPRIAISWSKCAAEVLSPMNTIRDQVVASGVGQGLGTGEILRLVGLAYDHTEFRPSPLLTESSKLTVAFIESLLQFEPSVGTVVPYCVARC